MPAELHHDPLFYSEESEYVKTPSSGGVRTIESVVARYRVRRIGRHSEDGHGTWFAGHAETSPSIIIDLTSSSGEVDVTISPAGSCLMVSEWQYLHYFTLRGSKGSRVTTRTRPLSC